MRYFIALYFLFAVARVLASVSVLNDYFESDTCEPSVNAVKEEAGLLGVQKYRMEFTGLCWPNRQTFWQHRINVYAPQRFHRRAIVIVNGGTRNVPNFVERRDPVDNPLVDLGLNMLAAKTHSLVIEVKDVPNQYLQVGPDTFLKEDGILAWSWSQAMENKNLFLAAHLPMAKSTTLALDAVEDLLEDRGITVPESYMIAGGSKRGWAAWLTVLEDDRIDAIVPVVAGIIDTENTLNHVGKSLNGMPKAFGDYVKRGLHETLGTPMFRKLSEAVDPWFYRYHPAYESRFSMPKLHLIAGSDEFFVPDALTRLANEMPGDTWYRVIPNSSHYMNPLVVIDTLTVFVNGLNGKRILPNIGWEAKAGKLLHAWSDRKPLSASLWQAHNPDGRNFILNRDKPDAYVEMPLPVKTIEAGRFVAEIPVPVKEQAGYVSHFIEFKYDDGTTLTTPAFIYPDTYPGEASLLPASKEE